MDAKSQDLYDPVGFDSDVLEDGEYHIGADHDFILTVANGMPNRGEHFTNVRCCSSSKSFLMTDATFHPKSRTSTYVVLLPNMILEFSNNNGGKFWIWRPKPSS